MKWGLWLVAQSGLEPAIILLSSWDYRHLSLPGKGFLFKKKKLLMQKFSKKYLWGKRKDKSTEKIYPRSVNILYVFSMVLFYSVTCMHIYLLTCSKHKLYKNSAQCNCLISEYCLFLYANERCEKCGLWASNNGHLQESF